MEPYYIMKKTLTVSLILLFVYTVGVFSQNNRIKLTEHVALVNCGDIYWLEDDKNQMSISISLAQRGVDKRTGKKIYSVVCGEFSKTVVKAGVKEAIRSGINSLGVTQGTSLIVAAAGYAAEKIYNSICEYWGTSFE